MNERDRKEGTQKVIERARGSDRKNERQSEKQFDEGPLESAKTITMSSNQFDVHCILISFPILQAIFALWLILYSLHCVSIIFSLMALNFVHKTSPLLILCCSSTHIVLFYKPLSFPWFTITSPSVRLSSPSSFLSPRRHIKRLMRFLFGRHRIKHIRITLILSFLHLGIKRLLSLYCDR